MVTEDYVSFETAKLLKEKGFDEATNRYYNAQYDQIRTVSDTFMWHWNDEEFAKRVLMDGAIAIPTLQMAMKWLRENHNLYVTSVPNGIGKYVFYPWVYKKFEHGWSVLESSLNGLQNTEFSSPEEACEEGIKYCLENLV